MNYVLGFLFSGDKNDPNVLLIRKNRPHWQAGLLNGIGGKIEDDTGETSLEAMQREFREEACLNIEDWEFFSQIIGEHFSIDVYSAWCDSDQFETAKAGTDEPLEAHKAWNIPYLKTVPNLRILVPLALNNSLQKPVFFNDAKKE